MGSDLELPVVGPQRSSRRRRPFIVALIAGIFLGLIVFIVFARLATLSSNGIWAHIGALLTGRGTSIDISSPAVIEQIRKLSRLESVEYSVDKVVEGERQSLFLPNFLVGDKLLLVAHGEVVAGVDFNLLRPGDVSVHDDVVHVRLPKAQVLFSRIDNSRTRVYSRTTGAVVSADPDLESKVREAAEQQIAQAAISDGILDKAQQNARASVTTLLNALGFHTVDVQ